MQILDEQQIRQRIKRLAIEILENNYEAESLTFAGLNNNGYGFAELIYRELEKIKPGSMSLSLTRIRMSPANPLAYEPIIEQDPAQLHGKHIILVDDVANTGRTLFYALKPLLNIIPAKVEIAVLVDRKHKSFPIKPDYVGLSLATTLLDDIDVQIKDNASAAVFLN